MFINHKLIGFSDLRTEKGIGYSRDHLRRMVKQGRFPKPIPLSAARIAWRESDIDGWIDERSRMPASN